jgi:hypothetical protein
MPLMPIPPIPTKWMGPISRGSLMLYSLTSSPLRRRHLAKVTAKSAVPFLLDAPL